MLKEQRVPALLDYGVIQRVEKTLRGVGTFKLESVEHACEFTSWRKEFQVEQTICAKEQKCERTWH